LSDKGKAEYRKRNEQHGQCAVHGFPFLMACRRQAVRACADASAASRSDWQRMLLPRPWWQHV
jgi:hypothetical protein